MSDLPDRSKAYPTEPEVADVYEAYADGRLKSRDEMYEEAGWAYLRHQSDDAASCIDKVDYMASLDAAWEVADE